MVAEQQRPGQQRLPAHPGLLDGRVVVDDLTKVFRGNVRAVDRLSFSVEPGSVTGFLGPNGAGKTTTLRMVLGLVRPTSGTSTIGGHPYHRLSDPLRVVGAALEASSFHPARTGRNHLRILCAAAGLPDHRADQVLELVGLRDAARRKVRGYSMGMRQRLGLAATLLGDPRVLILDEPANGLDPEGIRWLRGFFRHMASEGRTVLVSSHQLNEVQEVADRVVILNRGRLVRAGSIAELTAGTDTVVVRSPDPSALVDAVARAGGHPERTDPVTLRIRGLELAHVGHLAFGAGVELHELSLERFDLEQLFFSLTQGQFTGAELSGPPPVHSAVQQQAGGCPVVGLIRAEFRKLTTTQVWFWMLIIAAALTALGVIGQIAGTSDDSVLQSHVRDVLVSATGAYTYVPLFVLGVLAVTTEYRYQTITPTVLATPSRWALITAKLITYALTGAVYALLCLVVELAIALPWLSARNVDVALGEQTGPLLAVFAVLALFAIVGVGAGALLRNQIVAVTVGIIFLVVVANLIVIIPGIKYAYPYLPTGAVSAIITDPNDATGRVINDVHLLSAAGGVVVLVGWGLAMAALGAGLTMRRDIS